MKYYPIILLFLLFFIERDYAQDRNAGGVRQLPEIIKESKVKYKAGGPKIQFIGKLDSIGYKAQMESGLNTYLVNNSVKVVIKAEDQMGFNPRVSLEENKSAAIKISLFPTLQFSPIFYYELSHRPFQSHELGLGYLSSNKVTENFQGFFASYGYRFYLSGGRRGYHYYHIMRGTYLKPEFAFRYYEGMSDAYFSFLNGNDGLQKFKANGYSLTVQFGGQRVIKNLLLIDFGLGIGFGSERSYFENVNYISIRNQVDNPVAGFTNFTYDEKVSPTASLYIKMGFLTP